MPVRTYYHVLGVSREATLEEITNAKNALAKVYHPDANMHNDIDTTAYMQEILEAYRTLSDPEKRRQYDLELGGGKKRVFRTFTVGDPEREKRKAEKKESDSFVTYWNAACKLNEIVNKSCHLEEQASRRASLPMKILRKIGKTDRVEQEIEEQLSDLSLQAVQYITILKNAGIPMEYWQPETMNWVLVRWGQNQDADYHTLFAKYDAYLNQNASTTERRKYKAQHRHFHNSLKRLLSYAL